MPLSVGLSLAPSRGPVPSSRSTRVGWAYRRLVAIMEIPRAGSAEMEAAHLPRRGIRVGMVFGDCGVFSIGFWWDFATLVMMTILL